MSLSLWPLALSSSIFHTFHLSSFFNLFLGGGGGGGGYLFISLTSPYDCHVFDSKAFEPFEPASSKWIAEVIVCDFIVGIVAVQVCYLDYLPSVLLSSVLFELLCCMSP